MFKEKAECCDAFASINNSVIFGTEEPAVMAQYEKEQELIQLFW